MHQTIPSAKFLDVVNRVNELENLIFTSENITELTSRVQTLESNFANSGASLAEVSSLLDLISKNNDNINAIINGDIPVSLQYNTDVVKPGSGIEIDKSVPNKIKVVNKNQKYNLNILYEEDTFETIINSANPLNLNQSTPAAYLKLDEFTNMIRMNTVNTALGDLKIYIDDTTFTFKEGQVLRFVFDTEFNIDNKNLQIFTDKINRFGFGELNKSIGTIASTEYASNKPIFELTCIDPVNYEFVIDILR